MEIRKLGLLDGISERTQEPMSDTLPINVRRTCFPQMNLFKFLQTGF